MPYPHPQSQQPSDLEQLAQIMQLVQPFQQEHQQQMQQNQLMQYHQQQLQQEAQQYAATVDYQNRALAQTEAHQTAQEQHAIDWAKVQQAMEEDRQGVTMYDNAMRMGVPHEKALAFLSPQRQQAMLHFYAQEHAKQVPLAQSVAAGIWNSPEALKRGMDPSTLEQAALASAGIRPADFVGEIDRSSFNPYPGYSPPVGLRPLVDESNRPLWEKEQKRIADVAAFDQANKQKQAAIEEKARLAPDTVNYPFKGGLWNPTNWGPNKGYGKIFPW